MVKNRPSEDTGARPPRASVGAPSRRPLNAAKVQSSDLTSSERAHLLRVAFSPLLLHSPSSTYEDHVAFCRFPSLLQNDAAFFRTRNTSCGRAEPPVPVCPALSRVVPHLKMFFYFFQTLCPATRNRHFFTSFTPNNSPLIASNRL